MRIEMNKNSKEYRLAYEVASGLSDLDSMDFHLSVVNQLHEDVIRKLFNRVMSVPDHKIISSRGALYTSLVKKHGWSRYRD
jgi:hypothetical protein